MALEIQFKTLKTKHCPQNSKLSKLQISSYLNPSNYSNKAVLKINQIEKGMNFLWPCMDIRYGNHSIANQIKKLKIQKQLHAVYNPHCEGILQLEG